MHSEHEAERVDGMVSDASSWPSLDPARARQLRIGGRLNQGRSVRKSLRVCSLFSGCGGLDLGLVGGFSSLGVDYPKTGLEVTWSADFDKDAFMTYEANRKYFGKHPYFRENIRVFDDFASLPDFDILAAGFPCQPFSNAGNREGIGDRKGRGTLFQECARFLEAKSPSAFVFENVKGILSTHMEDGTTVPDEIKKQMDAIGYSCFGPFLARSDDFGVPQQRHRVLMVGFRKDLNVNFDFAALQDFVKPESMDKRTVRDAIADTDGLPNADEVWDLGPQARTMVPMITRSWKDIPYDLLSERFRKIRDDMKRYRAPNFYRRFGWTEINGTITASAQPENCGILHPVEDRRYTIREIARIQSFPDDFVFEATTLQGKYKVIGNAVPPILGWIVGSALRAALVRVGTDTPPRERSGALPLVAEARVSPQAKRGNTRRRDP